jgi:NADH:ubiquinone oxidoreductase subunit 6 (subunit J)
MLGVTTLCAVVCAIPHQPFLGAVLVLTYFAVAYAGLPSGEELWARVTHDAVLGISVGLLVPLIWLFVIVHAASSSNEQIAHATMRLLTGPIIGSVCGATLAILRRRR